MTEQEIWDKLTKVVCDNNLDRLCSKHESEVCWQQTKALHQKIEETTFATVEQIEKSGWVSPEVHKQALIDAEEKGYNKGVMETHAQITKLRR